MAISGRGEISASETWASEAADPREEETFKAIFRPAALVAEATLEEEEEAEVTLEEEEVVVVVVTFQEAVPEVGV